MADSNKGLYDHLYERFIKNRDNVKGYDFQQAPVGNLPPPVVTFSEKVRWWTLDRWKRRQRIRQDRDRRLQDIVQIRRKPPSLTPSSQ
ncbi:MAG: hypothetical protein AB7G48_05975 [Nitrospiraceae bacterium]